MIQAVVDRLNFLCDTIPAKIRQLPPTEFTQKLQAHQWSKKEILGHLIDSAANNHQRFVKGQYETLPVIYYDQENWVRVQGYQNESDAQVVRLWEAYNRHLAHVMATIPADALSRQCVGKDQRPVTLSFLIEDYVQHLEHHLRQIISY